MKFGGKKSDTDEPGAKIEAIIGDTNPSISCSDSNLSIASSSSGTSIGEDKEQVGKLKDKYNKAKKELSEEKTIKKKLYNGLVKLASELKDTRVECKELYQSLKEAREVEEKNWYEGGMWRRPELLPGVAARTKLSTQQNQNQQQQQDSADGGGELASASASASATPRRGKDAVSLSDLFFDLVIVTALTRVGVAIQDRGTLDGPSLAYFAIFWLIWGKEASFSTRFDTTDLSSRAETLLTCFAVLFGSLSSTAPFNTQDATRVMILAAFVALLHFCLHLRVWFWFRDVNPLSEMVAVKNYATYIMGLTSMEFTTWMLGIFLFDETSKWRGYVFLVAILMSFRIPRTFLPNDFHAACSKRGVLFILLLGFILQDIVLVASPFFDYQMPTSEQYIFLGLVCFLLFCIKLLYVDDSFSVDPADHALLVSRVAGFFFHVGQLALLLSTTVLGAGLNLLTHSYLAATSALPGNAKVLVCGGFGGVIFSIGFIKSMHLRRVPLNHTHRQLFYAAYGTQVVVLLGVVYTSISMSLDRFIGQVMVNELMMLGVLCCLALFLLVISWLDEAVELNIYGGGGAREFRVHPFGLWICLKPGAPEPPLVSDTQRRSHLSAMLKDSSANLFDSQINLQPLYGSIRNIGNNGNGEGERVKLVKFSDETDSGKVDVIV
mmetsp:Transcript_20747/g.30420  ORF Transcript_20747/g.30420 Transcript_20747/m.30420 type:complete len:664 (-) Transcript_20747:207-2198(-)|eukprot:CAMPEP_0197242718 /NCGR_PEP_ID=MMETSP1429-20130617/8382_1 /TAXON_ID=49237 /ORGANISM="Chaetoceros  sp., Strain UNC1202" /LENGTH=663 /DNA_ID=CAMNT_0042702801 /DNA_START=92 /DNA_END=2083 /DNA_ORIENTATION=+